MALIDDPRLSCLRGTLAWRLATAASICFSQDVDMGHSFLLRGKQPAK
jgi:hypothetical protein